MAYYYLFNKAIAIPGQSSIPLKKTCFIYIEKQTNYIKNEIITKEDFNELRMKL